MPNGKRNCIKKEKNYDFKGDCAYIENICDTSNSDSNINKIRKVNKFKINISKKQVIKCEAEPEYEEDNSIVNLNSIQQNSLKLNINIESNECNHEKISSKNNSKTKKKTKNKINRIPPKMVMIPGNFQNSMVLLPNCLNTTPKRIGKIQLCKNLKQHFNKNVEQIKKYKFKKLPTNVPNNATGFTIINSNYNSTTFFKKEIIEKTEFSNKIIAEIYPEINLHNNSELVQIVVDKTASTKTGLNNNLSTNSSKKHYNKDDKINMLFNSLSIVDLIDKFPIQKDPNLQINMKNVDSYADIEIFRAENLNETSSSSSDSNHLRNNKFKLEILSSNNENESLEEFSDDQSISRNGFLSENDLDNTCEENMDSSLYINPFSIKSEQKIGKVKLRNTSTKRKKREVEANISERSIRNKKVSTKRKNSIFLPEHNEQLNEQEILSTGYQTTTTLAGEDNFNFNSSLFNHETQLADTITFMESETPVDELKQLRQEHLTESPLNNEQNINLTFGGIFQKEKHSSKRAEHIQMNINEFDMIVISDSSNENSENLENIHFMTEAFVDDTRTELYIPENWDAEAIENILSNDQNTIQVFDRNAHTIENNEQIFNINKAVDSEENFTVSDSSKDLMSINNSEGTKICLENEKKNKDNSMDIMIDNTNHSKISDKNGNINDAKIYDKKNDINDAKIVDENKRETLNNNAENKDLENNCTSNGIDLKSIQNNFSSCDAIQIPGLDYDECNKKIEANIVENTIGLINGNLQKSSLTCVQSPPSESNIEINASISLNTFRKYRVHEIEIPERELYKNINVSNLPYVASLDSRLNKPKIIESAISIRNNDPRVKKKNICNLNSGKDLMQIFENVLQSSEWYQAKTLLQKHEINLIISELVIEIENFRKIKPKHIKIQLQKNVDEILNNMGIAIDGTGCIKEQTLKCESNKIISTTGDSIKKIEVYHQCEYLIHHPTSSIFSHPNYHPHQLSNGLNYTPSHPLPAMTIGENCQLPYQSLTDQNNISNSSIIDWNSSNRNNRETSAENSDFNNEYKHNKFNKFNKFKKNDYKNNSYASESKFDSYQNKNSQYNPKGRRFDKNNGADGCKYKKSWGGGKYKVGNDKYTDRVKPAIYDDINYEDDCNKSNISKVQNTSYRDWVSEKGKANILEKNLETNITECSRSSTPDWDADPNMGDSQISEVQNTFSSNLVNEKEKTYTPEKNLEANTAECSRSSTPDWDADL